MTSAASPTSPRGYGLITPTAPTPPMIWAAMNPRHRRRGLRPDFREPRCGRLRVTVRCQMYAKTELPGAGTRERHFDRPGVPLAASVAVVAAAGATWYGFLEPIPGHPTVRLAGALALAAVLMATPRLRQPRPPVPGPSGSLPGTDAGGTRTATALLGLLSVTAALIHLAVIEQHWAAYWLYGAFFIAVGLAQLAGAVAI